MRSLTIISGILMMATGAFCFINPGQTFMTMAFVIGAVMVICGIIHALAYLLDRSQMGQGDNNGWILTDALLTLLLGIMILCNQLTVDIAIPMIFGMWVLISGLLRVEAASRIDRQKKPGNFKAAFITGIVTVVVGLFGFVNPLVTYVSVVMLLGIFMLMQGINSLELGINMPHKAKPLKEIAERPARFRKITVEQPLRGKKITEEEEKMSVEERLKVAEEQEKEMEFMEAITKESIGLSREEVEQVIQKLEEDRSDEPAGSGDAGGGDVVYMNQEEETGKGKKE